MLMMKRSLWDGTHRISTLDAKKYSKGNRNKFNKILINCQCPQKRAFDTCGFFSLLKNGIARVERIYLHGY